MKSDKIEVGGRYEKKCFLNYCLDDNACIFQLFLGDVITMDVYMGTMIVVTMLIMIKVQAEDTTKAGAMDMRAGMQGILH
jgi:hypothetical protein